VTTSSGFKLSFFIGEVLPLIYQTPRSIKINRIREKKGSEVEEHPTVYLLWRAFFPFPQLGGGTRRIPSSVPKATWLFQISYHLSFEDKNEELEKSNDDEYYIGYYAPH
jgi:hypothetical protein